MAYEDRDPAVVVIGGSQCGLGIAASLGVLGVDTLVIDKHGRVGMRRKRYTITSFFTMRYLWITCLICPFRQIILCTFQGIKLRIGSNSTPILWKSTYGALPNSWAAAINEEERWWLKIRRGDGSERILHPRHVVMATGVSALPVMPDLPGQKISRRIVALQCLYIRCKVERR